jgi:hypothetical protein
VAAAPLAGLPMLVEGAMPPLEGVLALAASVAVLEAVIFAPLLLPPAVGLLAAELVVSIHRGELALWSVPLLAVGLLLVYETGELRHRLPADAVVEPAALRALAGRLAWTAGIGLLASATVLAAASLPSRGGAAAAIVGGVAVAAAIILVRQLGADARPSAGRHGPAAEPSDGLEPSTPSLPCGPGRNRSQPSATVFAFLSRFRRGPICHRLPPVAPALLHKCSISCRPRGGPECGLRPLTVSGLSLQRTQGGSLRV